WRKPLVVMTPKSLLKHPAAVSSLDELAGGRFQRVIPDLWSGAAKPARAEKILLTSGKGFYDLDAERQKRNAAEVAGLRLEQYYPLDLDAIRKALEPYGAETPIVWVQEEPRNMGAWTFLHSRFDAELLGRPLACVSRPESASPAIGSESGHKKEQADLIE